MKILGIYDNHNASAALYQDSCIISAAQEERFTREKNQSGFPKNAIAYCLESCGFNLEDIDLVVFSTTVHDPFRTNSGFHRFTVNDYIREQYQYWLPTLYKGEKSKFFLRHVEENLDCRVLKRHLKDYYRYASTRDHLSFTARKVEFYKEMRKKQLFAYFGRHDKVAFCDHHRAHSAYAYWAAPAKIRKNDRCLILSIDAFGDNNNCLVSEVCEEQISPLREYSALNICRYYKYATLLLGMKPLEHEYKVMGLAPYCRNQQARDEIFEIYKQGLWIDGVLNLVSKTNPRDSYFYFKDLFKPYRFDEIAAGIQEYFDSFLVRIVKLLVRKYKKDSLIYSGGAAMNVKTNMKLASIERLKDFYVSADPGDDSTSIGACLETASRRDPIFDPASEILRTIYLGHRIEKFESQKVIYKYFARRSRYRVYAKASAKQIARLLANDTIIARATGGMEFGARALGNRSILANPQSIDNLKKVNDKIKCRDFWMPFAPVILKEYQHRYIKNPKGLTSPYMTLAFPTTEEGRVKLKAAKHPYDHTVRPQILSAYENPELHRIIMEFGRITGVYALLNTSFNLHGRPLVCTAEDAARVFMATDLDGLILNQSLIIKNLKFRK